MTNESSAPDATAKSRSYLSDTIIQHPEWLGAFTGAIASVMLPIYTLEWKVSICNYGPDSDISGAYICIPVVAALGVGAGFVGGSVGRLVRQFLERNTSASKPYVIGSIAGGILGAAAGLVASLLPAFMLAFPDC